METLNVIGAGRVGRTLAHLLQRHQVFAVQAVLNGTSDSARAAVAFIGAGEAAEALAAMAPADVWMITTPDRRIAVECEKLAASGRLRPGDAVFHCSGALASSELASAAAAGARVASVHPLKTFAAPADAIRTFAGTPCVAEGDPAALDVLLPAFERIGARVLAIDRAQKTLYHAACVIVSNDLVALLEAGLRCFQKAGIAREAASQMIEPIVRETVDNVFRSGTVQALTGPVARGDDLVVARHLEALTASDAQITAIYRALAGVAVELAREKGSAADEALARIEALLGW
ncbi:MAG: hypothetical protein JWM26_821 [Betaproteobacteria bacterium]|nr:hypothetical protein [Betaproteobacteria bacterium]